MVLVGGSENQPASEDQGLRGGTGSNQAFELGALRVRQRDGLREGKGMGDIHDSMARDEIVSETKSLNPINPAACPEP